MWCKTLEEEKHLKAAVSNCVLCSKLYMLFSTRVLENFHFQLPLFLFPPLAPVIVEVASGHFCWEICRLAGHLVPLLHHQTTTSSRASSCPEISDIPEILKLS